MWRRLAIALSVLLVGCGPSEEERIAQAITIMVTGKLKDPDSAEIVIKEIFTLFDGRVACGTVNAKNSFGGYVGDRFFDVSINPDGSVGSVSIASDERNSAMSEVMCEFQKNYGALPGNSGKKATRQQAQAFGDAYTKKANETARMIAEKQ